MNNTAKNILIGTAIIGAIGAGIASQKVPLNDVVAQGVRVNVDGSETQVYGYKGEKRPPEVNEIIERRTKNSQTFFISDKEYRIVFYTGDVFYQEGDEWFNLEITTEVSLGFINTAYAQTTDTFYPSDAYIVDTGGASASWDSVHDNTIGSGGSSSDTTHDTESTHGGSDQYQILRTFYHFDTSSIPNDATISEVLFKNYVTAKVNTDNDGDDFMVIVQSLVTTDTTFVTGDYDLCGTVNTPTEGSDRIDLGTITTSAYNTWTLDSTGRGWVSLTDYTKLCLREGHDTLDTIPADNTKTEITTRTADYTGTASDPKLEVTYTVPASGTAQSIIWFD